MYKVFGFLKSTAQFLKIVIIFLILMLLLYWTENLAQFNWSWLNFCKPILDCFINTGEHISSGSLMLFEAKFEFKYVIAIFILLGLYGLDHIAYLALERLEEAYGDGERFVRKMQENAFNNSLAKKNNAEQKKIQTYQIFVSASIKKKFSHKDFNINLDEQLTIMNKFLMEKTGINPQKFGNGYLYTFSHFDEIDSTLEIFYKLIKSDAPLDYIICVQILEGNYQERLKKLVALNFENKISMLSETSYRYRFNKSHRYETSQLGLFGKEGETFEVHEFIEI